MGYLVPVDIEGEIVLIKEQKGKPGDISSAEVFCVWERED